MKKEGGSSQRDDKHQDPLLWMAIVCLALGMFASGPIRAEDTRLLSVSLRYGFTAGSPIGEQQSGHFQQYDAMALFELPWEWYAQSGWGIGTRLQVSAGALSDAGEAGFIGTLVPGVAVGTKNGRFSLEGGGGAALLSRYKFTSQDFGGPFQFVWNIGIRGRVYRSLGLGYYFQHVSDATIYGSDARGYDLHLIELGYRF